MRHEGRILPAGSYRDEPHRWHTAQPLDPRADRAVRIARVIDRALPRIFLGSVILGFAVAVWGALGGPMP